MDCRAPGRYCRARRVRRARRDDSEYDQKQTSVERRDEASLNREPKDFGYWPYLAVNHIYFPLAQSSGKILELLRANKTSGGDRTKKLFQFLNIIGGRALSRHLGRVFEMAEDSADKWDYEARIARRFGLHSNSDTASRNERGRQLRRPLRTVTHWSIKTAWRPLPM
jgi:hypothetical protein